jgi:hypothetical protein
VASDLLSASNGLTRALSADDAVYAVAQTCSAGCTYDVLVTNEGQGWRTIATDIPDATAVNDLAFSDGRFVAVGRTSGAAVWTSLGSLWTIHDAADTFSVGADGGPSQADTAQANVDAVVLGPLGWLAGGDVGCGTDCLLEPGALPSRYAAWLSPTGPTWSRLPWQPGPSAISRLASNGSSYVASSGDGLWLTTDGQAWQQVLAVDPASATVVDVAARNGEYLAVGYGASSVTVWTSADGLTWTEAPASAELADTQPTHLQVLAGEWVIAGEGSLAAAGPRYPMAWSSTDATIWQRQLITTDPAAQVADISAVGATLIAIGSLGVGSDSQSEAWLGSLP